MRGRTLMNALVRSSSASLREATSVAVAVRRFCNVESIISQNFGNTGSRDELVQVPFQVPGRPSNDAKWFGTPRGRGSSPASGAQTLARWHPVGRK